MLLPGDNGWQVNRVIRQHAPYLSALDVSHDKALCKSTDTLLYPAPKNEIMGILH